MAGVAVAGDRCRRRARRARTGCPGGANPTPASAAYRLGLSPQTRSRIPAPTTSGSVRRAAHEHVEPLVARPVVGSQVDDVEAGAGEDVPQLVRVPAREEPSREVVVRERSFALTLHHREVRGRVDREGVVQLHERPRQPVARRRADSSPAPTRRRARRAGTAAPRGRPGRPARRARPRARARPSPRRRRARPSGGADTEGAAPRRTRGRRPRAPARTESPRRTARSRYRASRRIAPLGRPCLVHRHGVAIHRRSIAA